jgi:hypothetical protein
MSLDALETTRTAIDRAEGEGDGGEGGLRIAPLFLANLAAIRSKFSRFKTLTASSSFVGLRRMAVTCGLCRHDVTQNVTRKPIRRRSFMTLAAPSCKRRRAHRTIGGLTLVEVGTNVCHRPATGHQPASESVSTATCPHSSPLKVTTRKSGDRC